MGDNYIVSMARNKHLINVHTGTGTTSPTGASLYLGEIAVQHTPDNPALWIKMGTGETSTDYEKFIGETEILELMSGGTDMAPLSAAVISMSAGVKSNEYVAASALNYLNDRIDELSGNTGAGAEPLSASVLSLSAAVVTISADSGVRSDLQALSSATQSHIGDTDVHVTTAQTSAWNGKQDAISDLATIRNNASSGASAYTRVNALSSATVSLSSSTTALSSATASHVSDTGKHLPTVSSGDNGKVLTVQQGSWTPKTPITVYGGTDTPGSDLGNNGDIYLQSNPVVIYETDGTTGLTGHNTTALTGNWQLENLDLTPYKEIRCYFKGSDTATQTAYTPSVVVVVPLDDASESAYGYIGGTMAPLPFNTNREYLVSCAVDTTKTKFQVILQETLWDISTSDANNDGRYLYKIEAYV